MRFLKAADAAQYRSLLVFAIDEQDGRFGREYRFEVMTPAGFGERRILTLGKSPARDNALKFIRRNLAVCGVVAIKLKERDGNFAVFSDWPNAV